MFAEKREPTSMEKIKDYRVSTIELIEMQDKSRIREIAECSNI